eukprot:CAMPEP_0205914656 /NCGR_PEP_ID=MMETSP1325-20131115/7363_1 /ASSEMBLY_ACC=CAM_ASM_000708 /TAXON_ID=236786 /ORGANISM="Florenciella sp., Strain RCC1007" /LENGTH=33 /DNA_ID= /DNA_START= /DNA_END= /DNA_ORIENTATION=
MAGYAANSCLAARYIKRTCAVSSNSSVRGGAAA